MASRTKKRAPPTRTKPVKKPGKKSAAKLLASEKAARAREKAALARRKAAVAAKAKPKSKKAAPKKKTPPAKRSASKAKAKPKSVKAKAKPKSRKPSSPGFAVVLAAMTARTRATVLERAAEAAKVVKRVQKPEALPRKPGSRRGVSDALIRLFESPPLDGKGIWFRFKDGSAEGEIRWPVSFDDEVDFQWIDIELAIRDIIQKERVWASLGLFFHVPSERRGRYKKEGKNNSQEWLYPRRANGHYKKKRSGPVFPIMFLDVRALTRNILTAGYVLLALGVRVSTAEKRPVHWNSKESRDRRHDRRKR